MELVFDIGENEKKKTKTRTFFLISCLCMGQRLCVGEGGDSGCLYGKGVESDKGMLLGKLEGRRGISVQVASGGSERVRGVGCGLTKKSLDSTRLFAF